MSSEYTRIQIQVNPALVLRWALQPSQVDAHPPGNTGTTRDSRRGEHPVTVLPSVSAVSPPTRFDLVRVPELVVVFEHSNSWLPDQSEQDHGARYANRHTDNFSHDVTNFPVAGRRPSGGFSRRCGEPLSATNPSSSTCASVGCASVETAVSIRGMDIVRSVSSQAALGASGRTVTVRTFPSSYSKSILP